MRNAQLGREHFLGGFIPDQLDRGDQTLAARIAHNGQLVQGGQAFLQIAALGAGVLDEFFLFDDFEIGQGCGAHGRMTGIGVAVPEGVIIARLQKGLEYFLFEQDHAKRQITTRDAFSRN